MGSRVAGLTHAMGAAGVSNRSASRSGSASRSSRSLSSHEGPVIKPSTFIYPPLVAKSSSKSSNSMGLGNLTKSMGDLRFHPGRKYI